MYDSDNNSVTLTLQGYSSNYFYQYKSAYLNAGIYRIESVSSGGGDKWCDAPQFGPPCSGGGGIDWKPANKDSIKITPQTGVPGPCTTSQCFGMTHFFKIQIINSVFPAYLNTNSNTSCTYDKPLAASDGMMNPLFGLQSGKKMMFSAWVREYCGNSQAGIPCNSSGYSGNEVQIYFGNGNSENVTIKPAGSIIEGWQRFEGYFTVPAGVTNMDLKLVNNSGNTIYYDDIRVHPFNANMKSYIYDPVNLRLLSQLDGNNYASYYEYDEEGTLIRTKVETRQGVKTVTEGRSAKQKNITDF
jgi:hypothetical protein